MQLDLNTPCEYPDRPADKDGYVRVTVDGTRMSAHRKVYLDTHGPLAEGWVVEHECHKADFTCRLGVCAHRSCINPKHLLARPPKSDFPEGEKPESWRWSTHCTNGHEYTEQNTYIIPSTGKRACRMCIFLRHQEMLRKKKLIEYGLAES